MKSVLPDSSFVPFNTRKLSNPTIAWVNSEKSNTLDVAAHAYCIPTENEPESAYSGESKIYFGERYGGTGIGSNGGGVRCGFDGNVQIKGIGKNPLAGSSESFWHSHGGASLEEGIREAVWGEVCHVALPYDAVRVQAIITTGTRVPYMAVEGERTAHRALILREATLRPAHYMRAIGFSPSEEMLRDYPTDVTRTKASVQNITKGFQETFGGQPVHPIDIQFINECLQKMFRRFAAQIAAGHAKRIMHGTLGPSNICLDGRWIDYGTITTVSDYGRIALGTVDGPDMWTEHTRLPWSLNDLFFYLTKYLPGNGEPVKILADEAIGAYNSVLKERNTIEFLKLTGIPESHLVLSSEDILNKTYKCFRAIIARGNLEPFKFTPTHVWEMPKKMGHFHLNTLIRVAALCNSPGQIEHALISHISDDGLRSEFISCYWSLKQDYLSQFERNHQINAKIFLMFNALRLNTVFPDLYRTVMEQAIPKLVATEASIYSYIEAIVKKAKTLQSEPTNGRINLSAWFSEMVEVDEVAGVFKNGCTVLLSEIITDMDTSILTIDEKKMAQSCITAPAP